MTGSTENSTAQIAQELGSIVSNNALQVWLTARSVSLLPSKLHGWHFTQCSKGWDSLGSCSDTEQLHHEKTGYEQ